MKESHQQDIDTARWYILNHIGRTSNRDEARKAVERYNRTEGRCLELFAPSYVVREEKDGVVSMRRLPLTYHYVFVRGALGDIKRLCGMDNGYSFLLNRCGTERYASLDDCAMENFRTIARAYENSLPYYPLEGVDLESGDLVEVVNGDFPGLVGTFLPKAKGKTGNIVLRVDNNWGTVAYDIKVSDLRILEFAKGTSRVYDIMDAFYPRLLDALRLHSENAELPTSLCSHLAVFVRRMEAVRPDSPKVEAKLSAMLSVASLILGDTEKAGRFKARCEGRKGAVSNEWTSSFIHLLFGVSERRIEVFESGLTMISGLSATSKAQHRLKEEYIYYGAKYCMH